MALDAKTELKIAVVEDIGNDFDDLLEAAQGFHSQCLGAKKGVEMLADNVRTIADSVNKDSAAGKIATAMKEGELAVVGVIKSYLGRVLSACDATEGHFFTQKQITSGKIQALETVIKHLGKKRDTMRVKAERRLAQAKAAVASGDAEIIDGELVMKRQSQHRPTGTHPGPTLKQERLAQAAAAEAAAKAAAGGNGAAAEPVTAAAPATLAEHAVPPMKSKAKKKRSTKKKRKSRAAAGNGPN